MKRDGAMAEAVAEDALAAQLCGALESNYVPEHTAAAALSRFPGALSLR